MRMKNSSRFVHSRTSPGWAGTSVGVETNGAPCRLFALALFVGSMVSGCATQPKVTKAPLSQEIQAPLPLMSPETWDHVLRQDWTKSILSRCFCLEEVDAVDVLLADGSSLVFFADETGLMDVSLHARQVSPDQLPAKTKGFLDDPDLRKALWEKAVSCPDLDTLHRPLQVLIGWLDGSRRGVVRYRDRPNYHPQDFHGTIWDSLGFPPDLDSEGHWDVPRPKDTVAPVSPAGEK